MKKLSTAMETMLVQLEGTVIHRMTSGLDWCAWYHETMKTANLGTLQALIDRELVRFTRSDWRGSEWVLSDSGKEALAAIKARGTA